MFVLVSGVSTATSPRWRVIYISRLGSRLWDRPAKPGIAVVSQFEFRLSTQSGSSIYRRLVLGGDIAAIPEKLTLAGFSGLSAKAQHCFGARKRLVPVGEPCQALRGELQF